MEIFKVFVIFLSIRVPICVHLTPIGCLFPLGLPALISTRKHARKITVNPCHTGVFTTQSVGKNEAHNFLFSRFDLCLIRTSCSRNTPEKFENAASFLGLPSSLIRHENGVFRKRSSNLRNLKTPALHFSLDGKRFENGAFKKTMVSLKSYDFPVRGFSQSITAGEVWTDLIRFQRETSVFKLLSQGFISWVFCL